MGINSDKPTRKSRAARLRRLLEDGPALSDPFNFSQLTGEQVNEHYLRGVRRWLDSWIIPEVERLVPELVKEKKVSDER